MTGSILALLPPPLSSLFALPLLVVWVLLGLCLLAHLAYSGISMWAAWKWRRATRPLDPEWVPPVTLLKPVYGVDAHAYDNFASFCRLDYPPDRLQIVFGALDPADPALAVARQLQADFPDRNIRLIAPDPDQPLPPLRGHNRKVCNLVAMLPAAQHDLLVLCDSDMRVRPNYLREVVAPFKNRGGGKGVGLVTCPYRGFLPESLAARLEALGIGADFIPSTLVSRALEGVGFALGSTIALPRTVLAEIGGFESILDELADDFRLGEGVRRAGYEVVLSNHLVDDVLGQERFGPMWARRLRWARTVRACRPAGYAGAFVTYGTALALLFWLVSLANGAALVGTVTLLVLLAWRIGTAIWIAATCTNDPNLRRYWYLLPLSDLLSAALYVVSFCGRTIVWRGQRFRLHAGGRIEHIK